MRRIIVSCAVAAGITLTLMSNMGAQQKSKAGKTPKAAPAAAWGNADAITQEELKVYDYFLASDQLEGRNFPSRGYDTAALYVASHLAEWGLKPGGSTTGTNGPLQPYFMPIEMVARDDCSGGKQDHVDSAGGGWRTGAAVWRGGRRRRRAAEHAARAAADGAAGHRAPPTSNISKDWTVGRRRAGGRGAGARGDRRLREPGIRRQRLRDQQDQHEPV